MRGPLRRTLILSVVLVAGAYALADGDTRPASPAEKAFGTATMGVLCGAIPKPPAGWVVTDKGDLKAPSFLSGSTPRPMELVCEQVWEDRARKQGAQADAMNAMANVKPDRGAEATAAAAQKRFEAVMAKVTKAAEKNDQAEIARLQPEMQAASEAYQKAALAQSKGFTDAAAKANVKDADAKVKVETNARYEYIQLASQGTVSPGVTAYRSKGDGGCGEATWVFLGPWQVSKDRTWMRFEISPLKGSSTSVLTVKVRIQAEPQRALAIAKGINWPKLQALMK